MAADVAAASTAIATAIRRVAPTSVPQTVNFQPFSGDPLVDFRIFREQLESSIELARVPAIGRVGYLKLHLQGGALKYFLELPDTQRNRLTNALACHESRYLSGNRVELYKLKFQERKFNQSKEADFYCFNSIGKCGLCYFRR